MNDKIIALVDGSVYAASVCEHAGWLAARSGMPVELLHVLGRRSPPRRRTCPARSASARAAPCWTSWQALTNSARAWRTPRAAPCWRMRAT
ncbi:universal stress protein [Paracoccus marcusii]|uniref:universal stress protein n=1 Tax=Paracoccus marcusii TaxID=59779 RepID=UPI002ED06BF1|nr:universal stress protein [Paracoccus marcusii]